MALVKWLAGIFCALFIWKEMERRKECSKRFLWSRGIAESTPLVIPQFFKEKVNFRGSNRQNIHVTDMYTLKKNFHINVVAFLSSPFPLLSCHHRFAEHSSCLYLFSSSFHLCFLQFSCFRPYLLN